MIPASIDERMDNIETRMDANEKRSQEIFNRILFQQERMDQVLNLHSNMIESMDTTVELFSQKEICLREWFMRQVEESRKFSSSIIIKLVTVYTALVLGMFSLIKLFPGG